MIQVYQQGAGPVIVENRGKTLELQTDDLFGVLEGLQRWNSGMYIQEALGFLSAGEREFIMTGITPDEWDAMFNCHDMEYEEYEEYENEYEEIPDEI